GGFLSTISNSGIYSFNSFVFPEYRSKKIFKSLISYVYKDMQKQGYKYVANLANVDNTPAVKGRESFNIKKKHIYIMLLPFNLRIIFNGPIGKGKLCK
ncbi:hypothetical protein KJ742_07370, partial [Patescibacteria group bacterium]|nr:hypothetical protein [Patescibacteria group bacterium]